MPSAATAALEWAASKLSLQIDALEKPGIAKSLIFMDKLSGARSDRPGLAKCLGALQGGDVLVVWRRPSAPFGPHQQSCQSGHGRPGPGPTSPTASTPRFRSKGSLS
jgi:hypothetical protein